MQSDKVPRAEKTAPLPENDKGDGLEGMNASGAGLTYPTRGDQGKGPARSGVESSK